MTATPRFDQRAIAVVELMGTTVDCGEFEQALAERRWPILRKEGGPSTAVTAHRTHYLLECRFPGSRFNARRGARERIEVVADELQLDLNVEVTDLVGRDPEDRPVWFAYERPEHRNVTSGTPTRWERWKKRARLWCEEQLAPHRTGRRITAVSRVRAQELATRTLPGTATPSSRVTVRRSAAAPDPEPDAVLGRRRRSGRQLARIGYNAAVVLIASSLIARLWPQGFAAWWVLAVVVVTALGLAAHSLTHVLPARPGAACGGALALGTAMAVIGTMIELRSTGGWDGAPGYLLLSGGYVVFTGIRLLVRQWSWRVVAPWLLPAVLPLALGFFPSLGLGLHAFYLDAFDLNLEDVEIPRVWQFIATAKLGLAVNLWLIALAGLGYMQHLHWRVRDRWLSYTFLGFCSTLLLIFGGWNLGLEPAGRAGLDAVKAAESGQAPEAYFGITPEWVCLRPVGPADGVYVDGGEFHPSRPYLRVGDAGGTVVLWDRVEEGVLKMPMNKLRIIPVDGPSENCAAPS
ncbi:hypothetical protein ACFVFD_10925 [Streptomyces fimicarius]|uniref:hypothetical protein n=1 Tax=Streptomyces griseus TaxID=1911 RepID=UPI0036C3D4DA